MMIEDAKRTNFFRTVCVCVTKFLAAKLLRQQFQNKTPVQKGKKLSIDFSHPQE